MAMLVSAPLSVREHNLRHDRLRLRREAIEDLKRAGVIISPAWETDDEETALNLPALNILDFGADDFQSAPDAVEMSHDDIANVESISVEEVSCALAAVAARLTATERGQAYRDWQAGTPTWPDADTRWTLTPHELLKLKRLA